MYNIINTKIHKIKYTLITFHNYNINLKSFM